MSTSQASQTVAMARKSAPAKRRGNWKDGLVTVEKIQELLNGACPHIFMMANQQWISTEKDFLGLYSSQEMHKGFNSKLLVWWAPTVLNPLVANDLRGGFYSQDDMQKAVTALGDQEANSVHVKHMMNATGLGKTQLHTFTDRGRLN